MSSSVIAVINKEVTKVQDRKKKRGSYSNSISSKEKATVAKYASESGIAATIKHKRNGTQGINCQRLGKNLSSGTC